MISLILIIIAGFLNACMDVVSFHYDTSIFSKCWNEQWLDPRKSWKNKWKWHYDFIDGEEFFGSSTFLVFLTDFWHLCKFLMLGTIMAAIVFYNPLVNWWADILILYCAFTVTFEIFFSKILIRNKNI